MPITTTDVCTNVVSGVETAKNGTVIVSCSNVGSYKSINATFESSLGYSTLESKYTNRFDDVRYYTLGTATIVGG